MRISELSSRSGVPVPTIKYYLREGLLPAGELTAQTQARYDVEHLTRLRLIRALATGAALPIAAIRQVLQLIDDPPEGDVTAVFGRVQELLTPDATADVAPARALAKQWDWNCESGFDAPLRQLAHALAAADDAGFAIPDGVLDRYAQAMHDVAEIEIANTPTDSLVEAVRYTVLGSVLMEPVLLALRRLAEADVAVRSSLGSTTKPR